MLKDHEGVLWLAGQVFLSRNFVQEADNMGLDAVFAACPYPLTDDQKTVFRAAFGSEKLRLVVRDWWLTYDKERDAGVIPKVSTFWES